MFNRHRRPLDLLLGAALFCATAGVPTPRLTELVACPYLSFCLPRAACQSSYVTFDANYSYELDPETRRNGASVVNPNDFACGLLRPSAGHVCCAVSSGGFLPSAQSWMPNTPPSAPAVIPWPGFQPNTAYDDGYLRVKNLSMVESRPNANPTVAISRKIEQEFKAIIFPGEVIEEINFRSAQQNEWSCGEVLSPSALNETYTVEERPINQGDYPWQVAVLMVDMHYMCGGALVGSGAVLTLASCIRNVPVDQILIRIGDQDLSSNREALPAYDVPVKGITLHPAFNPSSRLFDLAILQLQHGVSSLPYVRGACLPLPNQDLSTTPHNHQQLPNPFGQLFLPNLSVAPDLTRCHLASWGLQAEEPGTEGSFSYILRGGQFYTLSREVCQVILGRNDNLSPDERCAAGYGGTAICRGGGGSALVCRAENRFVLEGIIARSTLCSRNTPLVYLKVADHLNFIFDHFNLHSSRKEELIQPATSTSHQGYIFNSNEKTDGIPFNLREDTDSKDSANATTNFATIEGSRNDAFEGFPNGGDLGGKDGIPLQSNGNGRVPFERPGKQLSQITFNDIPVIGYSSVNNIGNGQESFDTVQSGVVQSSFFQFGDVIVPGGSDQQKKSGSNIVNNSNIGQDGTVFVSGELVSPQAFVHHKEHTFDLRDDTSTQTSDDILNVFIDNGEITIPKRDVDLQLTIIDINDHNRTNSVPDRDGMDLVSQSSDKIGSFIWENGVGHGDRSFRPSIVNSPTTPQQSFQTEQISGHQVIGSFIDDRRVNLPLSQSVGRTDTHEWRPLRFLYPPIPRRGFQEYKPINAPWFPHGRKSRWQADHHPVPLFPSRGYWPPLPSYPHPKPLPHPPRFNANIGPRPPYMLTLSQSFSPIFTQEPPPNPPPFFNGVPGTPLQLVEISQGSGINSDQTIRTPQPDATKSDESEVDKNEKSITNLHKVHQYLSKFQ